MSKNYKIVILVMALFILILVSLVIYFAFFKDNNVNINTNNNNIQNGENNQNNNGLNLPTEGNDNIIKTKSKTQLRIVNEYDKIFFTKNKNLLIMFASWCPNCQEEISEIKRIVDYYKNNKDINVIVLAHEYNDTVNDLIKRLENDIDFGDIQVFVDLGRVFRKSIDPEASTIPISYVVDRNGKILSKHDDSITLNIAKDMLKGD